MRKYPLVAVLAVVLAVSAGSLAFAGGGGNGNGHNGVRVLHVTLQGEQQTDFDLGATGPSVGDRFIVFADVVKGGQKVGQGGYECTTLAFKPGTDPNGPPEALTDQCNATITLERGQIAVQGLVDRVNSTLPLALPIIGGTGAYQTAHGQVETSGPDDQGNEALTLRLILGKR